MITEHQYLEALKIIKLYHVQLGHVIDFSENDVYKTRIEIWFSNLISEPSTKLRNALLNNKNYESGKPFKYVEDITRKDFLRTRGVGQITWDEFKILKYK